MTSETKSTQTERIRDLSRTRARIGWSAPPAGYSTDRIGVIRDILGWGHSGHDRVERSAGGGPL